MDVSCLSHKLQSLQISFIAQSVSIPVRRHSALSNEMLFYHLDNVSCSGSENMLSECDHNGISIIRNCYVRWEGAGVICKSKCFVFCLNYYNNLFPKVLLIGSVMKLTLDLLMDKPLLMVEWRYVCMGSGPQYVIMGGMTEMHKWCVDN